MAQTSETNDRPIASQGRKRLKIALGGLSAIILCVVIRYYWGGEPVNAAQPAKSEAKPASSASNATANSTAARADRSGEKTEKADARPATPASTGSDLPMVVANINTQRITRNDLSRECLRQYGNDVLESMVNKMLIIQECKRKNITVTAKEVDDEIERMAQRFKIPVDRWITMLKQERNITKKQYANDIIWPTLALRKLAGSRLQVTDAEMVKEYETMYGEKVRARLIAVSDLETAKELQAQAAANPEEFGNLAKEKSEDGPSASAKGLIQPIRKHGSYKEIENAVFNMTDGEVSQVIQAGPQYVILKREGLVPAQQVKFEEVAPQLEEVIRDTKMRSVAQDLYKKLQDEAKVENVWNDPQKHAQMPDVAALINGSPISIADLAEECVERHAAEVLEGMINRKLLEDACVKRNITITDEDVQKELEREALAGVKPNPDGSPNVKAWMEIVTKKKGVPAEIYRSHVLWPTAVLKKLVSDKVDVTEEDLKKAYDANFGPRVQCLAIVFDNQRRAAQVFEMARKNNTSEYFGELASHYSVEPGSQSLRGEVPPIRMNGGQPILEKEAFSLKPGELSGIIPIDDKFVLLRCQSIKEPTRVDFAQVRNDLHDDIFDKKLQLAMRECFEHIQESATIDNFVANTSHSPNQSPNGRDVGKTTIPNQGQSSGRASGSMPANMPELHQVPGG
jgi:parvulin-like peptidyl-prolyl isomerase